MRWLVLLLLFGLAGAVAKNGCNVREFYSIAWGVHDPTERHKQMAEWLTKGQQFCKSTDFIVIWNNMSEWGGTADSHNLRGLVVQGYKAALEREQK